MTKYGRDFFYRLKPIVQSSAQTIVPIILDKFKIRSVVDVGCGDGTWLKTFGAFGIDDVYGIDGGYITGDFLQIPMDRFQSMDLSFPVQLGRRYDLVVSLEVAEHLPEASAQRFIRFLVSLGPLVYFSAAIPRQGGRAHINEQWQSYWIKQFAVHGFRPLDLIRPEIWSNNQVAPWYSQNSFIFADESQKQCGLHKGVMMPPDLVHPVCYIRNTSFGMLWRRLGNSLSKWRSRLRAKRDDSCRPV
jgi:hypothetical protein